MKRRSSKWLLLSGHRLHVAIGIVVLMTVVVLSPELTQFSIRNTTPLFYLASAMIGGNITLITVVVAINQVILSQELESPGSLRDEIERTADYQQTALDKPAPPTVPPDFLRQLLQQTQAHIRSLEGQLPDSTEGTNDRLLNELLEECKQKSDELESASNDLSSTIVPLLGINYADYIHDCYHLQSKYEEEHHEQLLSTLDALTSDLENLGIAQQYFTTAFIKEELATLSRFLVYLGLISVSIPIALLYQLTTYTGASPPMPELFTLTTITTLVGLLPLALLIAYIIQIATVTQYMASIMPFRA